MANRSDKVIPIARIPDVLKLNFRFKHIRNPKDSKGFFVKLERCPLPIYTDNVEYSGADVIAMLSKLDEWDTIIAECREGLYDLLEAQVPGLLQQIKHP